MLLATTIAKNYLVSSFDLLYGNCNFGDTNYIEEIHNKYVFGASLKK